MATHVYQGLALAFLSAGVAFVACGPSASSDDPTPSTTVTTPPSAPTTTTSSTTTTATPPPATPNACDGPGDAYVPQMLNNGICETAAPPNCLINEFSANFMCAEGNPGVGDCDTCCWGDDTSLSGGAFTYKDGASDEPSYTHGADSIIFTGTATEYSGFGLWFGPCTDASMWEGIELQITGDLGGGKLVAQLQTDQNYPMEETKGSCDFVALGADEDTKWNVCTNPQADVGEITADGLAPIRLPWSAFTGGAPVSEVDPKQLRGIQIQVGCGGEEDDTGSSAGSTDTGASSAAPAGPCTFNLEVHDLRWYKTETP